MSVLCCATPMRVGRVLPRLMVGLHYLKHDHRMGRCYLKGEQGDKINALGAAMGLNLRKPLAGLGRRGRCAVQVVLIWLEGLIEGRVMPTEYQSACG